MQVFGSVEVETFTLHVLHNGHEYRLCLHADGCFAFLHQVVAVLQLFGLVPNGRCSGNGDVRRGVAGLFRGIFQLPRQHVPLETVHIARVPSHHKASVGVANIEEVNEGCWELARLLVDDWLGCVVLWYLVAIA